MGMIFTSIVGQEDNVGDSVLRRGLVRALQATGHDLHVFVGDNSPGYIETAGAASSALYRSRNEWYRAMALGTIRKDTSVVLNAGERQFGPRESFLGKKQGTFFASLHRLGCRFIQTGVGIRHPQSPLPKPPSSLNMFELVTWRDPISRSYIGTGSVTPDWAFATGGPDFREAGTRPSERSRLAVSLRGDRAAPDDEWLRTVRSTAAARQLQITLVVQVARDQKLAYELADRLGPGTDVVGWSSNDHVVQEQAVRDAYRTSSAVLSDRLHSLVIGATEGAVPIGFSPNSVEKARRTLTPVGLENNVIDDNRPESLEQILSAMDSSTAVNDAVAGAARELGGLSSVIRQLVRRE